MTTMKDRLKNVSTRDTSVGEGGIVDSVAAIAIYVQPLALLSMMLATGYYFLGNDDFALSKVLIGLFILFMFFGSFVVAPHKTWPWHLIAFACDLAIFSTIYYWVWDDSFPLRYFWYGVIATNFAMGAIQNFLPSLANR
jgi:hypothetical protein